MEEVFDPYHIWLGIPPDEQPPNHYRLLGIRLFEEQPAAIEHAAEQRMAHLRSLQSGKHAALSQKLLNEVAAARVCLLQAAKRAAYDRQLREALQARPVVAAMRSGGSEADFSVDSGNLPRAQSLDASTGQWTGLGQLGEYELVAKLGEGGMGSVYKAVHTKLGRVVAIKVLPRDRQWDDRAKARFDREMKAVGSLDHPNIVRAMDAREVEGTRILVMEFVDGLDLAELVRLCHPMPVADACELIRQAALALDNAHQHGLVHRDVKASNLMLSRQGAVKLLDLGLARFATDDTGSDEVTAPGQAVGTVEYMAPEQVSDSRRVDIRADIYSLGCTFYKLLSGQTPFGGPEYRGPVQRAMAHVQEPVPSLRRFRGDVPDGVVAILDHMLAKQPEQRFVAPVEVADAIGPYATGSNLMGLVARAEGRPGPPPPPFEAQADQTDSDSSGLTRFFQQMRADARAARAGQENPWAGLAIRLGTIAVILLLAAIAVTWTGKRLGYLTPHAAVRIELPPDERGEVRIEIDGHAVELPAGSLPPEYQCGPGERRVVVHRPGFKPYVETVTAAAGGMATVDPVWVPWTHLVLHWPGDQRGDAAVELDGNPLDLAAPTVAATDGQVRIQVDTGLHKLRITRPGMEAFEEQVNITEGQADVELHVVWTAEDAGAAAPSPAPAETASTPPAATPSTPPTPSPSAGTEFSTAEQQLLTIEDEYARATARSESLAAAWDFRGALAALAQVRPANPALGARLAARVEEYRRMAAIKARMIARVNSASPKLQKADLLLRGTNGTVEAADDEDLTTSSRTGKVEKHLWNTLSPQCLEQFLRAVGAPTGDDRLTLGLLLAASGDITAADKALAQAQADGADPAPFGPTLLSTLLIEPRKLLAEGKAAEAETALRAIDKQYGQAAWFTAHRAAFDAAVRKAALARSKTGE